MDNFLKVKEFVSYQFFNYRKISINVEKSNISSGTLRQILEVIFVFSSPFWVEFEINVYISVSTARHVSK